MLLLRDEMLWNLLLSNNGLWI